jgi:hypothetical protein
MFGKNIHRQWLINGLLLTIILLAACTPREPVSQPLPAATAQPTLTFVSTVQPTEAPTQPTPSTREYVNDKLGLRFQFPAAWQGPDVYEWENGVRLEVGTDVVYPYGTGLDERHYTLADAYTITVQYDAKGSRQPDDMAADLLALADGESVSGPRSLITRVRVVQVGGFSGVEYIVTLPDSAQTEFFYTRNVMLSDAQSNLLSIMGNPNNVQPVEGEALRDAYQRVDAAHEQAFRNLVESIQVE